MTNTCVDWMTYSCFCSMAPLFYIQPRKWNVLTLDSQIKEETGYYLIVDGGYLWWPTLICSVKDDECFLLWSKMMEGARKDAKDTFGMLKGHFHYIKNWNKLNRQETVDHVFVTCCILHNMQLELNGFTDPDVCPPTASALRHYRQDRRGDCCWRRTQAGNRDIGEANVLPMDMGGMVDV
jgi:hypothetical protein